MKRNAMNQLLAWKSNPRRKPLLIYGARQVGKTYLIKKLADDHYRQLVYINFEEETRFHRYFDQSLQPKNLLTSLSLDLGQAITPGGTLIFFDEIQACPRALTALKYFCEQAPEYHVVAAGSLLGVQMAPTSFPVGKVDLLTVSPMTFGEFLQASEGVHLLPDRHFFAKTTPVDWSSLGERFADPLRNYLLTGGMPEVVDIWSKTRDITQVIRTQEQILAAYQRDFTKHTDSKTMALRVSLTWQSIVSQLGRENKKFIYQTIKNGARAREFELALNWLHDAGLIYKLPSVSRPAYPLTAFDDLSAFKIYLLDVGLLRQKAQIATSDLLTSEQLFATYKGALAENYIVQALTAAHLQPLRYHVFDRYEIDLLIQLEGIVIPVEIKSGTDKKHASLTNYLERYRSPLAIRFSQLPLHQSGKILNIPLYLADFTREIVNAYLPVERNVQWLAC